MWEYFFFPLKSHFACCVASVVASFLVCNECMPQILTPGTKIFVKTKTFQGIFFCLVVTYKPGTNGEADSVWILNEKNDSVLVMITDVVLIPPKRNSIVQFYNPKMNSAYRIMDFSHNSASEVLVENMQTSTMSVVDLNAVFYHVLKP